MTPTGCPRGAARELEVSLSTLDRMTRKGEMEVAQFQSVIFGSV